ncbi:MAG: hypothetical protein RL522_861 [Pseudomonadota bacterium]|jgi:sigma-E factor negative regulatory protein RseA
MKDLMNEQRDEHDPREWVSAMADGQLQGEALCKGLEALALDAAARERWQAYHFIGDVLRSPELAGGTPPAAFLARLSQRLAVEPLPLAPQATPPEAAESAQGPAARRGRRGAPGGATGIRASP